MNHSLSILSLLLVFASGCAHTPGSTIPTLPASRGHLSLSLARHQKLPVAPLSVRLPGDTPVTVVTAEQAPAVFAEAVQVLKGQPSPPQVQGASEDLSAACDAGLSAACGFLREQFTGPERLSGQSPTYPAEALSKKVFGITIIRCRLGVDGRFHACDVVERGPYGLTEDTLKVLQTMRYRPAALAGHPIDISFTLNVRMAPSDVMLKPQDRLAWARQRVTNFPQSSSAWLALAEQLAEQAPEDPGYVAALEQLHELLPRFWWSANELAWMHVQAGEYARAEELLRPARREVPLHAYVLETSAAIAFGLGECTTAVADQRTAVEQLPAEWPAPEREHFQQQLQAYSEQCAPPAAP